MPSTIVLCIDERPQILELRQATLESLGYCVRTASDGTSAMNTLRDTPVGVVLLEYKLEGMDAEAVALHVKQRFRKVPIILLSAFSEMPERILWLVDEYAMKSVPLEGLARVIERVVCRAAVRSEHKSPAGSDKVLRRSQTAA